MIIFAFFSGSIFFFLFGKKSTLSSASVFLRDKPACVLRLLLKTFPRRQFTKAKHTHTRATRDGKPSLAELAPVKGDVEHPQSGIVVLSEGDIHWWWSYSGVSKSFHLQRSSKGAPTIFCANNFFIFFPNNTHTHTQYEKEKLSEFRNSQTCAKAEGCDLQT